LGKSFFELIKLFDDASPHLLGSYERKYLTLMAARLLDSRNEPGETAIGLPIETFAETRYSAIEEVAIDFDKLLGTFRLEQEVPELADYATSYIQASTLGHTVFTERLRLLLDQPLMRRLATVSQLGLLNYVYPTATHTRLQHVLGTFTNTARYLYHLYHDPQNPFFRQIMTTSDLTATLVASLLHDLGQYPLAHDLQDASDTVFGHERLGTTLLKNERTEFTALTKRLVQCLKDTWRVDSDRVIRILEATPTRYSDPLKDRLLHTLISGPIDADKLDYLVRDANECQVPYAKVIDWERLLRTLTVVYQPQGGGLFVALGIHEKGKAAAECVAFARYAMFSQVYWHHTARAAKAMLHRVAWEWLVKAGSNDHRKTELYLFILGTAKTGSLFEKEASGDQPLFAADETWSPINREDRAMLAWLRARTSENGRLLINELLERRLYKRLAVVTHQKNEALWRVLQRAHREHQSDPEVMLRLARELHRRLRARVKTESERGTRLTTTGADSDAVQRAVDALEGEWTILVDIPSPRVGARHPLYCVTEAGHRFRKEEIVHPFALGDSRVWKLLAEDLHELAGKIRVFAHPAVEILGRTVLAQEAVEDELQNAAEDVLT